MDDDQFMPHLRTLPDGSLTTAEVCLLLDRIDADARRIEACDAEMDRLNCALVDAWAERDAALADVAKLREALDPLHQTLSFLRSVIASGEPMSPDVRQAIDNAQERLRLADTEEAKSDG